jgi:ABC-type amino acid transport substrate-binding protein
MHRTTMSTQKEKAISFLISIGIPALMIAFGLETFSAASQAKISAPEPIHVATSADYPPMETISGTQIVGYDIDLMNMIAHEISATVVYTNVPFNVILSGLQAGKYDLVISAVSVTPEREQIVDFALPYLSMNSENIAIAIQKGNDPLRSQINNSLFHLRNNGGLASLISALNAQKPGWNPSLPLWPTIYLPSIMRGF